MRRNYIVVADKEETRTSLAALLRSGGLTVSLAASATDVVQALRSTPVDTVLIASQDVESGADRLRARILNEQPDCRVVSLTRVNTVRGKTRFLRFGIGEYMLGERELLALLAAPVGAASVRGESSPEERALQSLVGMVDVLVGLLELGDRHFASSSHRAMQLARATAERMELPEELVLEIVLATLARDIGKYGLDKTLFAEEGALTADQASRMREHVVAGTRLLEHIEFPWKIPAIIRHHHERYDGFGYPDGLKGPEIPLGARILAVVDAFVAMLSDRPYRPCLSTQEALAELERNAGKQFDPEVTEIFMRVIEAHGAPLSAIERPKLMLADRDTEFVSILKMRLHNEGMEIRTATNLQDALLAMLEWQPTLILAQVDENEERSFEFLHAIREDEALARVPFAFLLPRFDLTLSVRVLGQGVDECLVKTDEMELLVARIKNILVRESRRTAKEASAARRGITGQLENLSLPDIVQMLNLGIKTACLSLASEGRTGRIWFESGHAVHAELGETRGVDAFNRMLPWTRGEFTIEHGLVSGEKTIEGDTMLLLMDGMRMLDESAATSTEDAAEEIPALA